MKRFFLGLLFGLFLLPMLTSAQGTRKWVTVLPDAKESERMPVTTLE